MLVFYHAEGKDGAGVDPILSHVRVLSSQLLSSPGGDILISDLYDINPPPAIIPLEGEMAYTRYRRRQRATNRRLKIAHSAHKFQNLARALTQ